MKKMQSLYKRDYEGTHLIYNEILEGSEWVLEGDGIATRKWDGTSAAIIGGALYKRLDLKLGRCLPDRSIPCEPNANIHTGHWPHWVPCLIENNGDKYHFEAFEKADN